MQRTAWPAAGGRGRNWLDLFHGYRSMRTVTLVATLTSCTATTLVLALTAWAEWRIAAHLGRRGLVGGPGSGAAAAGLAAAVVLLQAGIAVGVAFHVLRRNTDPVPGLASGARRIAAGERVEASGLVRAGPLVDLGMALARWQDAAALREALLLAAPVGVCVLDGHGAIRHANRAIHALLGSAAGELDGRELLGLVHPGDRGRVARLAETLLPSAAPDHALAEARLRRGDGTWRWCEIVLAWTGREAGGPDGFVATLRDVGERHREAERAARIQREMLPVEAPRLEGYALAGACRPAKHVAGDLLDWMAIGDGHLVLTLADVMGKGLGPALVMAALRTALRMAPAELGPADRVARAAESMTFGSDGDGLYVTLFHGQLDAATGGLRYVDAGHGHCLIQRASGAIERLPARSLPVGVGLGETFREGEAHLWPGDQLLVCSDGLVELDERPGRLEDVLARLGARDDVESVVRGLLDGVPAEGQADDVTVLVLRRLAEPAGPGRSGPVATVLACEEAEGADGLADAGLAPPSIAPRPHGRPAPPTTSRAPELLRLYLGERSVGTGFAGMLGLAALLALGEWFLAAGAPGQPAPTPAEVAAAVGWPALAAVPGLALLVLTGLSAVQYSSAPLPRLVEAARRIAAGEWAVIPHRERTDEVGDLARALWEWQDAAAVREVLLRSAPVGICLLDGRGVVRESNRALQSLLGYEREELEGHGLLELVNPEDMHVIAGLEADAMAAEGRNRAEVEARLRHGDGGWQWCEGVLVPVGPDPRAPDGFVVTLQDVAERRREAQRATLIQRQMLPRVAPALSGYELAGACRPAQDVAGDLYDWVETGPGRVELTLADVMGKGMGAALVMAALRTALRMAPGALGPARRLARAAESMTFAWSDGELFVTVFHAQLDTSTGRLRYVDAGHGHCVLRRADGTLERLPRRSLPLGVDPAAGLAEGEARLEPGDSLLLCSDGLLEAGDETDRLEDVARQELQEGTGADELVGRLLARVPPQRQTDDVTVLVLRRLAVAATRRRPVSAAPADAR